MHGEAVSHHVEPTARQGGWAIVVLLFAALMICVVGANWLVSHVGEYRGPGAPRTLPLGFGLSAPSGVLLIGASFTIRDALQARAGMRATLPAIVAGAALSALLSPRLALASGLTYVASETSDLLVYTPLHRSGRSRWAIVLSNTVGSVVDSFLFIGLGFGWAAVLNNAPGQIIGKLAMSLLVAAPIFCRRARTRTSECPDRAARYSRSGG